MKEYTQKDARSIFTKIATRYDLNNTLLSFGIHYLWKRYLVDKLLQDIETETFLGHKQKLSIIDLCTGTGDILKLLESSNKLNVGNSSLLGIDFCPAMLNIARKKLSSKVELLEANAESLPFNDSSIDAATIAFGLRNLNNFQQGLSEIHRILKPNACGYILEFGKPKLYMRGIFYIYSRFFMPILGGITSGDFAAYKYLHKTSWDFPCDIEMKKILENCGFSEISITRFFGGIAYLYIFKKKAN